MIDLIRELETGREEVSRYIPKFLGRMLCQLPDSAFDECRSPWQSWSIRTIPWRLWRR